MISYKGLWDLTYNSVNCVKNYQKLDLTFYFQPITAEFQVLQTCSLHQSMENWFLNIFSVSEKKSFWRIISIFREKNKNVKVWTPGYQRVKRIKIICSFYNWLRILVLKWIRISAMSLTEVTWGYFIFC